MGLDDLRTDPQTGIKYYMLPVDSILYRGDSTRGPMDLDDRPTFFGFDQVNVEENYGVAYRFTTKVELKLIALDKNQNTPFYNDLEPSLKRIMDVNYGYRTGIRDSVSDKDKQISAYICDTFPEYDGYACNTMPTEFGGSFHSEAMICLPISKLMGGELVTDPDKKRRLEDEAASRRASSFNVKQKKQRPSFRGSNLFGDDDEEETMSRSLFGGKKTKKSRKSRKSKKSKKSKKRRKTKKR
jgi:hypothetical protein